MIGCSARPRTFRHVQLEARESGPLLLEATAAGESAAVVFGPERMGLANQDLDRCSHQLVIPANPEFSSLNLAAAVQLVCYEIFLAARGGQPEERDRKSKPHERPSSQKEMEYFYEHLEQALDSRGFLDGEMRDVTIMKLRRVFWRARPNLGELKLLRTMMRLIHRDGQ